MASPRKLQSGPRPRNPFSLLSRDHHPMSSSRRDVACLVLLWMSGFCMRVTVMVVPPIIPELHLDLHLTQTDVGILSGLPPVLFALAAIPGALLVSRMGTERTLLLGLVLTAAASALRGASGGRIELYAYTACMGAGMSIIQPAMPQLVRGWMPARVGFGTALYMNGLLVGEVLAVSLMRPVVLPLADGSWRWALTLWSVPVAITAVAFALLAPARGSGSAATAAPGRLWWPDWRNPLVWRLGLMLGSINSIYFASNFFIPDYLTAAGERQLVDATLTVLNLGQVPASLFMLLFANRWIRLRSSYVVSGIFSLVGLAGMLVSHGIWIPICAGLFGFASTITFVLAFALPSLLAEPQDVHRVAAGMFTLSYSCAVLTPIVGGALWDATGVPLMAFAPIL